MILKLAVTIYPHVKVRINVASRSWAEPNPKLKTNRIIKTNELLLSLLFATRGGLVDGSLFAHCWLVPGSLLARISNVTFQKVKYSLHYI